MRLLAKVEVDEALDGNGEAGESMIDDDETDMEPWESE